MRLSVKCPVEQLLMPPIVQSIQNVKYLQMYKGYELEIRWQTKSSAKPYLTYAFISEPVFLSSLLCARNDSIKESSKKIIEIKLKKYGYEDHQLSTLNNQGKQSQKEKNNQQHRSTIVQMNPLDFKSISKIDENQQHDFKRILNQSLAYGHQSPFISKKSFNDLFLLVQPDQCELQNTPLILSQEFQILNIDVLHQKQGYQDALSARIEQLKIKQAFKVFGRKKKRKANFT